MPAQETIVESEVLVTNVEPMIGAGQSSPSTNDSPSPHNGSHSGSNNGSALNKSLSSLSSIPGPGHTWRDIAEKDTIVISGLSGRLPESDTIEEFATHLYNKEDMVTEDDRRWRPGYLGMPKRNGKLKDLSKFDAKYFGVTPKQADLMDPQMRILMEVVHEALVDAGINPQSLRGSRTGVFIGASASETEAVALGNDPDSIHGYTLIGCARSMFANRISYAFDFRGPSFAVDTACSSALCAFNLALDSIRLGHCEQAIVAGCMVHLLPANGLTFLRLNMMAPDGKSKSFDAKADGYVKAEGIVAMLLQRQDSAKRIYCTVVHAKSNTDGYKSSGITMPSGEVQGVLLNNVYSEAGVNPAEVEFFEAHGTGTIVGDPQECHAIQTVICANRDRPLKIGSVKSNMGHAEPTSGLASIAKMIVAMERRVLPPNLHFEEPNPYIPGLIDGTLQVVTEPTPWHGGYVGINSFGFGGANTHVLLKSNDTQTTMSDPLTKPKMVCYSAPSTEAVEQMLESAEQHLDNAAYHALISEQACAGGVQPNPVRGYVILNRNNNQQSIKKIQKLENNTERPIWFIYTGMGAQWVGMSKQLVQFDIFHASLRRCSEVLRPLGIDPYSLIMKGDADVYKNTLNCIVCNISVQIALTDLLRACGIEPSGIIGHSTGEISAGYADGCLTHQQTILCAYYRGKAIIDAKLNGTGAMAAVGLTWEEATAVCPEGVVPACHNSNDSVTISGETDKVQKVVDELKAKGKFAKMVDSAGVPFHSPTMQQTEKAMMESIASVIKAPKMRSTRWISTSVPESEWDTPLARECSASYQVNNAMNPVLFYDATRKIPEDAVCIEIAPHSLLQAILRRSLAPTVINVGLLKANVPDEYEHLLTSLGKLYLDGVSIQIQNLFEKPKYPVPRGTPMLSPLISWDHRESWNVVSLENGMPTYTVAQFIIEPMSPDSPDHYLLDHVIDGRALFPFVGYILLAWKGVCKIKRLDWDPDMPPPFIVENWEVLKPTLVSKRMKFEVVTLPGDSYVEIYESGELCCKGNFTLCESREERPFLMEKEIDMWCKDTSYDETTRLYEEDIYKMMKLRGYDYGDTFKCMHSISIESTKGIFYWDNNWVIFLDGFLQYCVLGGVGENLVLPARLRYLRVDPKSHAEHVFELENGRKGIYYFGETSTITSVCGGVEFIEPKAMSVQRRMVVNGKTFVDQPMFVEYVNNSVFSAPSSQFNGYAQNMRSYEYVLGQLLIQNWESWPSEVKVMLEPVDQHFDELVNNIASTKVENKWMEKIKTPKNSLVLGTLLHNLVTKPHSHVELKDHLTAASKMLNDDPLFGACCHERVLDVLISLVQQNLAGIKMKVCIVNPFNLAYLNKVILALLAMPRYKYDATCLFDSEACSQRIERSDLDKIRADSVICDPSTNDGIPSAYLDAYDMLILDRVLGTKTDKTTYLKNLKSMLAARGFVQVVEYTNKSPVAEIVYHLVNMTIDAETSAPLSHDEWMSIFGESGYNVVSYQTDESMWTTTYLLRVQYSPRPAKIVNIDDVDEYTFVEKMKVELNEAYEKRAEHNVWLTSNKVTDNGGFGMTMCLREEGPKDESRVRLITDYSLMNRTGNGFDFTEGKKSAEIERVLQHDLLINIYRDGKWGSILPVPRRANQDTQVLAYAPTEEAYLNSSQRGDLSSLKWYDYPEVRNFVPITDKTNVLSHKMKVHIHYASLNFRDIMLASGRLAPDSFHDLVDNPDALLGIEFSGVLEDGRRVMGSTRSQCLATSCIVDTRYCIPVPDNMTLEQAATIPLCYMTAYYAMIVRGDIRFGQSVLIHSGSGAVGQAALAVATYFKCEIFVTVGSEAKKQMLLKKFPNLKKENFASSRTCEFEQIVKRATGGKGVDLVLNSLADDKLRASVRCLKRHGKFLEIGKYDLMKNSPLGMECFMKDISFMGILLDATWGTPMLFNVMELIEESIADGIVTPLKSTVYPLDKVEEAFRFMASGKHTGKILIKIRDEVKLPKNSHLLMPDMLNKVTVMAVTKPQPHEDHVYVITGGLGGFGFELVRWLVKRGAKKIVLCSRRGVRSGYQGYYISTFAKQGINIRLCHEDITKADGCEKALRFAMEQGPIGGIFHLAMVLKDNILENQTPENFQESSAVKYWGTRHLDALTRQLCGDELKWFVCFSSQTAARGNSGQTAYGWANSTMERVVEQRRHDGLAGQAIQWGAIGDVGVIMDNKGDNNTIVGGLLPQRLPACLQYLDMIIVENNPLNGVYVRPESDSSVKLNKTDVLEIIANIIGIKDTSQLDVNQKLSDLGIDSLMGMEIVQMLERNFDIVLSMKDIKTLTLADIRNMTDSDGKKKAATDKKETEDNKIFGFNIHVDRDDFTDDMLKMLLPMNDIPETADRRAVYFVHPIEGVASPMKYLIGQLDVPVFCLQCTPDTPQDSADTMAARYIKEITNHRGGQLKSNDFHLVGYSFGAVIIYEMACQLSQVGIAPRSLTMIDGSPAVMQVGGVNHRSKFGIEATDTIRSSPQLWPVLESELFSYLSQHCGINDKSLKTEMMKCASTKERARMCAERMCAVPKSYFTDVDFAAFVCETLWNKFLILDTYAPSMKYTGDVNLIRVEKHPYKEITDDYGLGETVNGDVTVLRINGDHDSIVMGVHTPLTASFLKTILHD